MGGSRAHGQQWKPFQHAFLAGDNYIIVMVVSTPTKATQRRSPLEVHELGHGRAAGRVDLNQVQIRGAGRGQRLVARQLLAAAVWEHNPAGVGNRLHVEPLVVSGIFSSWNRSARVATWRLADAAVRERHPADRRHRNAWRPHVYDKAP